MRIPFIKMHGLGNDFVVFDGRAGPLPDLSAAQARAIADRRTGIGCDQLILIEASTVADVKMRIINADGGEVEACGNASRAVGRLLGRDATIETLGGTLTLRAAEGRIAVDLPAPQFDWQAIPLAYAMDTLAMPVGWEGLENPVAANVGNPHIVFFVADCDAIDLAHLGPIIEHDALFPQRINVNVATVIDRSNIRLRVWERGAGLTRACGTGACASAVAAMRRGLTEREVTVALPGGQLIIAWHGDAITMSGPASESFRGDFDPADYPTH